ncbi:AbrB/MazE/SpoVT family DNA-binding domain-containing protein [Paenibacillus pasadenensis]|uniref:AbrB/MazE/SpoVT family DNA-binding domain-containing protein n=1 Tax=Paenibacillus pasadenensis TaxID=217090 RepID=UPI0025595DE8|nr:AbrB/MazE/SpoVT family DNA-binding domain-containing protein [Paenibacillus pasadenensis]
MVDELGRIVLPIELRRVLELNVGDPVEFFVDESSKRLVLRKYRSQECLFCHNTEALAYFRNRFVCASCLEEMPPQLAEGAQNGPGIKAEQALERERHVAGVTGSARKIAAQALQQTAASAAMQPAAFGAQGLTDGRTTNEAARMPAPSGNRNHYSKGEQTARRLAEVMQTHPNASQGEWARLLGISQGRVSQLIRSLK